MHLVRYGKLVPVLAFILVLGACTDDDAEPTATTASAQATVTTQQTPTTNAFSSACGNAFAAAAAVGDMEDVVEDLYPAVRACTTVTEWTAASRAHPSALDGADPTMFLQNVCRYGAPSNVSGSALCQEALG